MQSVAEAHLVEAKRVVSSGSLGNEVVWTDTAILERANGPPRRSPHT